jgi:hypothetical protein
MNCRNCLSDRLTLALDLGVQPWGNDYVPVSENRSSPRYPLELFFCEGCSMVQIGHTIPKEALYLEHNYMSGTTRTLARHFEMVADRIMERIEIARGQYVLDVGGNDGTFLRPFHRRGVGVINVESGRKQARRSMEGGIRCVNAFFNEATAASLMASHGPARVIHGSGIFFHLEELHSVFRGIKALLDPDGLLVAEFIYLPEMVRLCAFDQIYHEHLLYYTVSTFVDLLSRHGLAAQSCEFAEIHGGSAIVYAGHQGRVTPAPALLARLAEERDSGWLRIDPYVDFAVRARDLRDRLRRTVRDLRARGLSIGTLGAPVKGSTIIHFCGFDEMDIQFATEINELKCGTYMPGTRIPVVHQASCSPPDVYLLLSWNFKDEILAGLGAFRAAGGRVLVPIPRAELL